MNKMKMQGVMIECESEAIAFKSSSEVRGL